MRVVALVVGLVVAATQSADAGAWYYGWRCSGECAPNQLAISGTEGPFASEDECNSVRSSDSRRDYFVAAGNLGGLDSCTESDGAASSSSSGGGSHRPLPLQRFTVGVLSGPGWHANDASGSHPPEGRTTGAELGLVFSGRATFGLEMLFGFQHTSVTSTVYGGAQKSMNMIPWSLGITITPALVRSRRVEARLDLAADVGALFRTGCDACDADGLTSGGIIWTLRAGLDLYLGHSKTAGLALDTLFTWGRMGDIADSLTPTPIEIISPRVMLRASLLVRSGAR